MNKRTVWVLGGIVALVSAGLWFSQQKPASNNQINIAANLPLTGPVAAYSGQYPNGFRMGIDEGSKKFGVDSNRFNMDFQDNAGLASSSVSVFQKQRAGHADVYISGTSEAAIAIAKQVDDLGIPNFLVAFDPFLAREGKSRLRILPNSKIEGPLFVQYAKYRKAKRVFVVCLNSAYAISEVDNIIGPGLKSAGIDYQRELYEFQLRDFKNISLKVKAFKPDVTFVIGYSFNLKPLLRDLRTDGLINDGNVMAVMDLVDLVYDNTPVEELAGIAFACPIFEIKDAIPGAIEWRGRYFARFGKQPTYVEAYAFDTAQLIAKTLKERGKVSAADIRAALPLYGITGKVNVDTDGDIIATITIAKVDSDRSLREILKPAE